MKERGWVQRGLGRLTVIDLIVVNVTERPLGRVVGRMSHRLSVSFDRWVIFLLFKRGWEWEAVRARGGCEMEKVS